MRDHAKSKFPDMELLNLTRYRLSSFFTARGKTAAISEVFTDRQCSTEAAKSDNPLI